MIKYIILKSFNKVLKVGTLTDAVNQIFIELEANECGEILASSFDTRT